MALRKDDMQIREAFHIKKKILGSATYRVILRKLLLCQLSCYENFMSNMKMPEHIILSKY